MADRRRINRDEPPPAMGDLNNDQGGEDDLDVADMQPPAVPWPEGFAIPPGYQPPAGYRAPAEFPIPPVGPHDDEPAAADADGPDWQDIEFVDQATEQEIEYKLAEDEIHRHQHMSIEVCKDTQEVREAYYSGMLPGWRDLTVLDIISLDEETIPDYIAQDEDNLVFVVFKQDRSVMLTFPSSRAAVNKVMPVYECETEGYPNMHRVFIPLNQFGAPFGGVSDYHMTKRIVVDTNYQVFFLREMPKDTCFKNDLRSESATLMSHGVKYWGIDAVSDAHCQDGTQRRIYQIHVPAFYF